MAYRGDGSLDTFGVCEQPSPSLQAQAEWGRLPRWLGHRQNGDGFLQARSAEGTVTTLSLCLQTGVLAYASRTLRLHRDASAGR